MVFALSSRSAFSRLAVSSASRMDSSAFRWASSSFSLLRPTCSIFSSSSRVADCDLSNSVPHNISNCNTSNKLASLFCSLISLHGIAMQKDLYFTALVFSFFISFVFFLFSTPNLWGYWTDLKQTWTHIHLWLLFEKMVRTPPGIYPPTGWGKKRLLGPTLKFDRTCLCNGIWHQQS